MPNWRVLTVVDSTVPGAQPPVDLILPDRASAQARAAIEKARPWVVNVSVHLCPHAAGESSGWYNCKRDARAQYEIL